MKLKKLVIITFLIIIFSSQIVLSHKIDSDGDGVIDEYDRCPGTNPDAVLPIILRNPEFLGCSCAQIYELMREEYCKDIYCHPGRPLEIRDRTHSSRPNPCPPPRCEGFTLYEYRTDEIRCFNGREQQYECEEIITKDADECINQEIITPVEQEEPREEDIFDLLISDYSDENSKFVSLLKMRTREEIIKNNHEVLGAVKIIRQVELEERTINNQPIVIADVSIIVSPNKYQKVENFVLMEKIIGDLSNKNLVFREESFFDEKKQIVVWEVDELKEDMIFTYRVTPGENIKFEVVVQGKTKSTLFKQLIVPLMILILIIGIAVTWIINVREKSNVFKN